jgi:hypothetical protein
LEGDFSQYGVVAIVEKIRAVARDTGIRIDNYEPLYARGAAEMILSMVDASYRRALPATTSS